MTPEEIARRTRFFRDRAELRAWFEAHHAEATEVWLGYPKKGVDRAGVSYGEAVEEALCFGWIDGQVRSLGPETYANRYTPRTARSPWSQTNLAKATELLASGRMHPAGRRAFESRDPARAGYSFEEPPRPLPPAFRRRLRADTAAWRFFEAQSASYRRVATFWVTSAARASTRERRLERLIELSRNGRRTDGRVPADAGVPKGTPRGGARRTGTARSRARRGAPPGGSGSR